MFRSGTYVSLAEPAYLLRAETATLFHGAMWHTSSLVTDGNEHACEPVDGDLVEDKLITETMWAGIDLASSGASEEVVDPSRGRHLIGMWLRGSRTRARSSCDLGFECADRPAARSRAPSELTAAAVVGFGQQDLSVPLGERTTVDQIDRFVWEVE